MVDHSKENRRNTAFDEMATELYECLTSYPRKLHTSLGYYSEGSNIFEEISKLEEYYPPKVERKLLYRSSQSIIELTKPNCIIDLGCGNMEKTQIILHEAVKKNEIKLYGCDIVSEILDKAERNLRLFYNYRCEINTRVMSIDYMITNFYNKNICKLFTFLGSTYGNLSQGERNSMLSELSKTLFFNDHFLIGIDLVKDRSIIEPAYNDSKGLTAKGVFEMLIALNEEFGGEFDLNSFQFDVRFEPEFRRAASYLISKKTQKIPISYFDIELSLEEGEEIQAEIYQKFVLSEVLEFIQSFGLRPVKIEVDDEIPYALLLFSGPKENVPTEGGAEGE